MNACVYVCVCVGGCTCSVHLSGTISKPHNVTLQEWAILAILATLWCLCTQYTSVKIYQQNSGLLWNFIQYFCSHIAASVWTWDSMWYICATKMNLPQTWIHITYQYILEWPRVNDILLIAHQHILNGLESMTFSHKERNFLRLILISLCPGYVYLYIYICVELCLSTWYNCIYIYI